MSTSTEFDFDKPFVDPAFTRDWWVKVCADEGKLKNFIFKLCVTEANGFWDNLEIMNNWCSKDASKDKLAKRILQATAQDEAKHAELLRNLLTKRGWLMPPVEEIKASVYWDYMDAAVNNLKTACAVCFFGEKLAADRFQIMLDMECTPDDVREFLKEALPDEAYHATSFRHLATDEVIKEMYAHHLKALELTLTSKKKD